MLASLFLVAPLAGACGDDSGSDVSTEAESSLAETKDVSVSTSTSTTESTTTAVPTTTMNDAMDHEHDEGEEIPAADAPSVDFEATQLDGSRVEMRIVTTSFEIVDDGAEPTGTAPYAGHAHLLVGGEVAAMVYSDTYEIDLAPGENEVTVQLANLHHMPYLIDGEPIEITKMVHVPETPDEEFHVHEIQPSDHTHEHEE